MRRAESVPSDINNRIDHTAEIPLQFGTLPKVITKRVRKSSFLRKKLETWRVTVTFILCVYVCLQEPTRSSNQLDSSSNPSSATSSAPSSPAHLQQSNPPSISATPPPNPSPQAPRDNCFHFPGQNSVLHAAYREKSLDKHNICMSSRCSCFHTHCCSTVWQLPWAWVRIGSVNTVLFSFHCLAYHIPACSLVHKSKQIHKIWGKFSHFAWNLLLRLTSKSDQLFFF